MTLKVRYIAHLGFANVPHVHCLIESIRQFQTAEDSPVTLVADEPARLALFSSPHRETLFRNMEIVWVENVEKECGDDLPFAKRQPEFSPRDYSWLMQSCLPWWAMTRYPEESQFVYVDTDIYFFQSLVCPYLELLPERAHVAICPHLYPPGRENIGAGKYNNGLLWWRNSYVALQHMLRWGRETIDRWRPGHPQGIPHEQKLLDEWPEQLGDALVHFPPEVNAGPWRLADCSTHPIVRAPVIPVRGDPDSMEGQEVMLLQSFHFHETKPGTGNNPVEINGQAWNLTNYPIPPRTRQSVYEPYLKVLEKYVYA